jgi:hypothetical protein
VNRHQKDVIDYLREEHRILRHHLSGRPLRLTDAQRRRLAVRGKTLGRRALTEVASIVPRIRFLGAFPACAPGIRRRSKGE